MSLGNLFTRDTVAHNISVSSKKQLLQELVKIAERDEALTDCGATRDLLGAVLERERLGTTGIGSGVAIPHARIANLCKLCAVFATLDKPISYDAVDDRPVDIAVLLLAPENAGSEHLRALAQVSRALRREEFRDRLRAAPSAEALYLMLTDGEQSNAA